MIADRSLLVGDRTPIVMVGRDSVTNREISVVVRPAVHPDPAHARPLAVRLALRVLECIRGVERMFWDPEDHPSIVGCVIVTIAIVYVIAQLARFFWDPCSGACRP